MRRLLVMSLLAASLVFSSCDTQADRGGGNTTAPGSGSTQLPPGGTQTGGPGSATGSGTATPSSPGTSPGPMP